VPRVRDFATDGLSVVKAVSGFRTSRRATGVEPAATAYAAKDRGGGGGRSGAGAAAATRLGGQETAGATAEEWNRDRADDGSSDSAATSIDPAAPEPSTSVAAVPEDAAERVVADGF